MKVICSVLLILTAFTATAFAEIPYDQMINGDFTYYDDAGYGACGSYLNANTEKLVAISYQWFTSPNPNNDPVCKNTCVQVNYGGKSITLPVKDKCMGCSSQHIDLSKPAFEYFAPPSVGHVYGAQWKFVHC